MTSFNCVSYLWADPRAKHSQNFTYGYSHANKLFRQLAKGFKELNEERSGQGKEPYDFHLTLVTDSKEVSGIDTSIPFLHVIPLWQDFRDLGRCFTKLKLFSKNHTNPLYGDELHRSALFPGDYIISIDLDIVITNPKEFVRVLTSNKLQGFKGYRDSKNPRCYSGALWRIDTRTQGEWHHVYDTFRHTYETLKVIGADQSFYQNWNVMSSFVGSDQSWISTVVGEGAYPDKWNDRDDGVWDFWQIQDLPSLPLNTVAVFMNGMRRDASMKEYQEKYPWIVEKWVNV